MKEKVVLTKEAEEKLKNNPAELLREAIIAVCDYPGIYYYMSRRGIVEIVEEK